MPDLSTVAAEPSQGAQLATAEASVIVNAENIYDNIKPVEPEDPPEEPYGGPFDPDDNINWRYWRTIGFGKWEVRSAAQTNGTQYGCASSALSIVTGKEPAQFMEKTDEEGVIACLSVTAMIARLKLEGFLVRSLQVTDVQSNYIFMLEKVMGAHVLMKLAWATITDTSWYVQWDYRMWHNFQEFEFVIPDPRRNYRLDPMQCDALHYWDNHPVLATLLLWHPSWKHDMPPKLNNKSLYELAKECIKEEDLRRARQEKAKERGATNIEEVNAQHRAREMRLSMEMAQYIQLASVLPDAEAMELISSIRDE